MKECRKKLINAFPLNCNLASFLCSQPAKNWPILSDCEWMEAHEWTRMYVCVVFRLWVSLKCRSRSIDRYEAPQMTDDGTERWGWQSNRPTHGDDHDQQMTNGLTFTRSPQFQTMVERQPSPEAGANAKHRYPPSTSKRNNACACLIRRPPLLLLLLFRPKQRETGKI